MGATLILFLIFLSVIVSCIAASNNTERSFCYAIRKKRLGTSYIKFINGFIDADQQRYLFSICEAPKAKDRLLDTKQDDKEMMIDPTADCKPTWKPPKPDTECCGFDTYKPSFIIGGEEAEITQYPWLVAIEYRNTKTKSKSILCGGSLISGRYVITAGHCVVGSIIEEGIPFQVRLGDYNLTHMGPECSKTSPDLCTEGEVTITIEKIILHPKHLHERDRIIHDIALIRLEEMAPYTNFIVPICLPSRDVTADYDPESDLVMYAVGWGSYNQTVQENVKWRPINEFSDVKRHVELPVRNITECCKIYGHSIDRGIHICAGGEGGRVTCKGDSGGPLVYNNKGVYELAGVVSFGSRWCGSEGNPGVYTNVFQYLDWIMEHITN